MYPEWLTVHTLLHTRLGCHTRPQLESSLDHGRFAMTLSRLGRYEISATLGRGAMGVVIVRTIR